MNIKRKLILSVFMLVITAVTLTSTTFAWFVKNSEAWSDEFGLDIENTEGLLMSIDGVNYSQDLTIDKIKEAINLKTGADYSDIKYGGVTLKHDSNKKIQFDNTGKVLFEKDALERIGTTDRYSHKMVDADINDYVAFDLYLKVITTGSEHADYKLKLHEGSYISAEDSTIELTNSLSTSLGQYVSGDMISVNPKNAMRLGISYTEITAVEGEEENIVTNKIHVYEPNVGLGSSAIEGDYTLDPTNIHNKDINAMYTYYNNSHPLSQFTTAALDGEGFNTLSDLTNGEYGIFSYSKEKGEYNTIKISVYVWLEGWDADYFALVPADNVKVKLGFTLLKETM